MSGKMSGICLGDAWEHIKPLGRGSFGTVHLYRHVPSQAKYAVKFVERGELTDNVIMKVRASSRSTPWRRPRRPHPRQRS